MKTILCTLALFSILNTFGQTNLSGGIYASETWTLSGSPYIVSGNLVVFEGVEINVEPGVEVLFDQFAGLELRGKLTALGTAADPITFSTSQASGYIGAWNGIDVIGTTNPLGVGDQVTMEYVRGMYANTFIDLDIAYHGPYNFRHCYFATNGVVNNDGGLPATNFDYCTFQSNAQGLDWCQFDSRATHCFFFDNNIGLDGIKQVDTCYFSGHVAYAMAPYGSTTGCTIVENVLGVKTVFNAVNHTFVNNTVAYNGVGMEIGTFFNGSHNVTGNKICNNINYNVKLLTSNNADLSMNCWCSTDENYIRSTIYDGYVNTSYGLVTFAPMASSCPQVQIVGAEEIELPNLSVAVYPNPFSESVHFQTEDESVITIRIIDMFGREIIKDEFHREVEISTLEFDSGLYLYELTTENGTTLNGKLIKE